MDEYRIPNKPLTYSEGSIPELENADSVTYDAAGEMISVTNWIRYPSYDFIIGIPAKDSPRYAREVAFFGFRDSRDRKNFGLYLDVLELESILAAFSRVSVMSQKIHPEIWKKSK